ncbi:hypothetical protein B0H13DRAFT_1901087 [Mycena leptocephala]|nr:hypothetical protein B0H13DRAFT_1901087 [Mycena leptocephala]
MGVAGYGSQKKPTLYITARRGKCSMASAGYPNHHAHDMTREHETLPQWCRCREARRKATEDRPHGRKPSGMAEGATEAQKDAVRKDGPSAGGALRRRQHNSSQGNGGRALQNGEARERGDGRTRSGSRRIGRWSVCVGAQAAKAPVPMLAWSGRAGVAAAYRTVPKMLHPQSPGQNGTRERARWRREAARRHGRQGAQESVLRPTALGEHSNSSRLGSVRITGQQDKRGRFYGIARKGPRGGGNRARWREESVMGDDGIITSVNNLPNLGGQSAAVHRPSTAPGCTCGERPIWGGFRMKS